MARSRVHMDTLALAFLFLLFFLTHATAEESKMNSTTLPSTTTSKPKNLLESKAVKSALTAVRYHKYLTSSSSAAKSPSDRPKKYTVKVAGGDDEEDGRYIIIDSGSTDTNGAADFLIAFGAAGFAVVCALALLGIVLAVLDKIQATPSTSPTTYSGYGSPTPVDSYSSYKRALDVSRALELGYSQYAGSGFQETGAETH